MEVHKLGKKQLDILYPMVSCFYAWLILSFRYYHKITLVQFAILY